MARSRRTSQPECSLIRHSSHIPFMCRAAARAAPWKGRRPRRSTQGACLLCRLLHSLSRAFEAAKIIAARPAALSVQRRVLLLYAHWFSKDATSRSCERESRPVSLLCHTYLNATRPGPGLVITPKSHLNQGSKMNATSHILKTSVGCCAIARRIGSPLPLSGV